MRARWSERGWRDHNIAYAVITFIPVCVIKANFLQNQVPKDVYDSGREIGQLITAGVSPPLHQEVGDEVAPESHHCVVEQYPPKSLLVLLPVHLQLMYSVYRENELCGLRYILYMWIAGLSGPTMTVFFF